MFYNCHIHTFTKEDVPERFLPLGLVKALNKQRFLTWLQRFLERINPFTRTDRGDQLSLFLSYYKLNHQSEIFAQCQKYYPQGTCFSVLSMDMAFMGAGNVRRPYSQQLDELAEMAAACPQVLPFIHADARRPGIVELCRHYIEQKGFRGIKIYPPLGYFPYDERLDELYAYCDKHHLPVMAHCSQHDPVYFKGSRRDLDALLAHSRSPIGKKGKNRRELCSYFTNPANYLPIIEKYPNIRICFSHFGSMFFWEQYLEQPELRPNWFVDIRELIAAYPQFYADISYVLSSRKCFPLLKTLLADSTVSGKILFGSDFYVTETQANEYRFSVELRAYLGEDYFKLIAVDNPKKFLQIG